MSDFSPYTPLHHPELDDAGLARGTRVWMASGSFLPVEQVEPGQFVFGVTFRLEDDYIGGDGEGKLVKVWRPALTARKVRGVREVTNVRSWQLTFGDYTNEYEHRRLVCGGDTRLSLFPLTHHFTESKRLVDAYTATENPRAGTDRRRAMEIDQEESQRQRKAVWRPTPFTGQPRGDQATIIPYECYGGQMGMLRTDIRSYNRYLYAQVRRVVPVEASATLYQLDLQPDTTEEFGASPEKPRCNVIAQTPFRSETKRRAITVDDMATEVAQIDDPEELKTRWQEWGKGYRQDKDGPSVQKEVTTRTQGMFYESQNDEKQAKALEKRYGLKGGFLNGGILIDLGPTS